MRSKAYIVLAALAAALPLAHGDTGSPPPSAFARELYVPFDDLGLLLQSDKERVLLGRAEFEALLRNAERKTAELAPVAVVAVSASCEMTVEQDRVLLKGRLVVEVLREGLHAVQVDLSSVGLRGLTLDGAPAAAGLDKDGRLVLFVEKLGKHTVEYDAVAPLQISAAQQVLSVRLPEAAATAVRVTVPGDVEVRSGAAVAGRVFDPTAGVTRLELVPDSRDLVLVMSLNSRLKRQDRVVVAQSVLVDEITQAYERLHATISLDVIHQAVKEFRFKVPAGFEITQADAPDMARWEIASAGGSPVLVVGMRDDAVGKVTMHVSAIRAGAPAADWSFPILEPLDVAGSVAVMGILLEERLRLCDVVAPGVIPIDHSVLEGALPPAALKSEAGEVRVRPVAAWYAPDITAAVKARFEKPAARLQVTANTLVTLKDSGLEASGGLAVMALEEKLFSVDIGIPPGWDMREVKDERGTIMPFERLAAATGSVVHVALQAGADAGQERRFFFSAVHVPDNWFSDWSNRVLDIPEFPVAGATRDRGAVAVDARDDIRASPVAAINLYPLDENEKEHYSLAGVAASLAHRYESRPYRLRIGVERIKPRMTAETFSFFVIDREVVSARCEVVFKVTEARTRQVALLLGTNTPASLSVTGVSGTQVKEYAVEQAGDRRRWVVRLAGPVGGSVHLAVDYQMPLPVDSVGLTLDPVRADGVAYQSGFVAVEGSPELDVNVERHPRKVDIGELVDAVYRPGRRLLGAYGFVGEPEPIGVAVARRGLYRVPPSIVQRAELTTVLGAAGTAQTMFHLSLRNKLPFVELVLPEKAVLWSVLVDGKPSRPQQRKGALLIGLPAGKIDADVVAVYEQPVARLGFWTTAAVPAPRLFSHDGRDADRLEVPISDATWRVYTPTGHRVVLSSGVMSSDEVPPIPVAPVQLAKTLYQWAGGIDFHHGVVGACSAPFQRAAQVSRKSSDAGQYDGKDGLGGPPGSFPPAELQPDSPVMAQTPRPRLARRDARLVNKLNQIVIPEVDFRQANIYGVVEFLQDASREFDQTGNDDGSKGVKIVLALPPGQPSLAPEVVDPFAAPAVSERTGADLALVTFTARQISLGEVLRIVAEVSKLKIRYEGNTVMLVPLDAPGGREILSEQQLASPIAYVTGEPLNQPAFAQPMNWSFGVGKWNIDAWAAAGSAGLTIDLSRIGRSVVFSGLDVEPALRLNLIHEKRAGALALAAALGVLLAGLRLLREPLSRKTRFVGVAMLVSTLVPAVPGLVGLALVLNGVFYAACGLLALYLIVGFARRRKVGTAARAAVMVVALLIPVVSHGANEKPVLQPVTPDPVQVPKNALVVPYRTDAGQAADSVLVPYDKFRELLKAANPEASVVFPVPFAIAGGAYTTTLFSADALVLRGTFTVIVFAADGADVPLPLSGGVLESAKIDGVSAMVRSAPVDVAVPSQRGEAVPQQVMRQQGVVRAERPVLASVLYIPKPGTYRLELVVRMKIGRQGGWRTVEGRLPVAPATSLELRVPAAQTEVLLSDIDDRASYRTQSAGETIATALGKGGRFRIQWRPVVAEGEIDRTLTAESLVLLDAQEDGLYEVWHVALQFRRGERDVFVVDVPAAHIVEKVSGDNVKGWETADVAGTSGAKRITVRLLKAAENQEQFSVVLRRPMKLGGGEGVRAVVPCLVVPDAVRHTGRITLRHSPLLVARAIPGQGVRRTDLAGPSELAPLAAGAAERALGVLPYQTYEFMAAPFELAVELVQARTDLKASLKTILRVAERDRSMETRVELNAADRPLYEVRFGIPGALDIETVSAPGTYEWAVVGEGARRVLIVRFAVGLSGSVPVVIGGPLRGEGAADTVALPQISVVGATEQDGDIAVQADPASDVKALELKGLEPILVSRVQGWLRENQKELVRLALHHSGSATFSGRLQLVPRQPDVSAVSATNVRVTDRAIEETTLLHFSINGAGIREVRFVLPARLADARISVPLLRRKTVAPMEGRDSVMVILELQDEVMKELKVLVESDRLLVQGREETAVLPVVLTGRTDRRYLAIESAGRDEVVITSEAGFEPLSRQQKEWAAVALLFRGGSTRAFMAGAQGDPVLKFSTRQRAAVETAGARIGLAQTVLVLDAGGGYRATQTYHVDNRTEQFLELVVPAGSELWTAEVAGEPVKPVRPDKNAQERIRIPLVKTASGDLDYKVILHYGGTLSGPGSLRSVSFPLLRAVNIGVELSQVQLRLPRTHKWMRFDGTMREVGDAAEYDAGVLSYQNKVAQRLLRTLQFGSVYEKARSASNLRNLKKQIHDSQYELSQQSGNAAVNVELANAQVIINDTDQQLAQAETTQVEVFDNRLSMNETYGGQTNAFTKNVVLNKGNNWAKEDVARPDVPVAAKFNASWFSANGLVAGAVDEGKSKAGQVKVTPLTMASRSFSRKGQASYAEKAAVGFQQVEMNRALVVPERQEEATRRGKDTERADRYADELRRQEVVEIVDVQTVAGNVGEVGQLRGYAFSGRMSPPQDVADYVITPAASAVKVPSGLASLSVELPADDARRWATHMFTTARGDIRIEATAMSERFIDSLRRVGMALAAALFAALLPMLFARRVPEGARRAATSTMIIAGSLGLLAGVFPIAGVLLAIVGMVLKASPLVKR